MDSLKYFYLKKYESDLVLFMINGISDENEEISDFCKEALDKYGQNIQVIFQISFEQILTKDLEEEVPDLKIESFSSINERKMNE